MHFFQENDLIIILHAFFIPTNDVSYINVCVYMVFSIPGKAILLLGWLDVNDKFNRTGKVQP